MVDYLCTSVSTVTKDIVVVDHIILRHSIHIAGLDKQCEGGRGDVGREEGERGMKRWREGGSGGRREGERKREGERMGRRELRSEGERGGREVWR